jgi:hypothetical protein
VTDHSLHGNHDPCPACEMRREMQDLTLVFREPIPCNVCGGVGFLALSDAEIVRRTLEEARRIYWPAFEAMVSRRSGPAEVSS